MATPTYHQQLVFKVLGRNLASTAGQSISISSNVIAKFASLNLFYAGIVIDLNYGSLFTVLFLMLFSAGIMHTLIGIFIIQ